LLFFFCGLLKVFHYQGRHSSVFVGCIANLDDPFRAGTGTAFCQPLLPNRHKEAVAGDVAVVIEWIERGRDVVAAGMTYAAGLVDRRLRRGR
jgi:hypothetical protein